VRELLGTDAPPLRPLAIAWAALGGWALGSAFYLLFVRHEPVPLLFGVPAGLLSAFAMAKATRAREDEVPSVIVGYSVLAAIFCPAVTFGAAALITAPCGGGSAPHLLGIWIGGSVVGAFFAAPLGTVFGVVYAMVWRFLDASRRDGGSARESAWIRFGIALSSLGAGLLALDLLVPPVAYHYPFAAPPPRPDFLALLGWFALTGGALPMLRGLARWQRRRMLLERVRRGRVPGWALVRGETIEDADSLPRLFPGPRARYVLVQRAPNAQGPFRSSETAIPVARA